MSAAETAALLAAHPRFEWTPPMCTATGRRLTRNGERSIAPLYAVPDLHDPATEGVLLRRLLTDDPTARLIIDPREGAATVRIVVTAHGGRRVAISGADLGEALARGLLAVWGPA